MQGGRGELSIQQGNQSPDLCGPASPSPEVLKEMQEKHPQAPSPALPSGPAPPPFSLSEPSVPDAVKSFPNGSAPVFAQII